MNYPIQEDYIYEKTIASGCSCNMRCSCNNYGHNACDLRPAAQTGTPDVPESAGYGDLDAGDFKFYAAGNLTAENGKTDIWLTNPAEKYIWLKARLLDKDENILGESGLIKPGEYIQSIELDEIPKGTSSITLKIMAYAPDTYQSAGAIALNTDLKAE